MVNHRTLLFTVLLLLQHTGALTINPKGVSQLFPRTGEERLCLAPQAGRATLGSQAARPKTSSSTSPSRKHKVGRSTAGFVSTGAGSDIRRSDFTGPGSKVSQLQRRVPFGASLPPVENNPDHNLRRIDQIIEDDRTTALFSNAGAYSNSHSFPTSADQQLGTTTGGLGFNKIDPDYPKIMFEPEVMGFLTGKPDNYGDGEPLVTPGVAIEAQRMFEATTHIITPGAGTGTSGPSYRAKIASIGKLTTGGLQGNSKVFPYKRPTQNQPLVRVTVEYCATDRHLRIMISDNRNGGYGGTRVFDAVIPKRHE